MFRRPFRFVALFVAALAVVSFLPLHVERTFVRLFLVSGVTGEAIQRGAGPCARARASGRTTAASAMGDTVLKVREVKSDVPVPEDAFGRKTEVK